jgi:hypothetical protein
MNSILQLILPLFMSTNSALFLDQISQPAETPLQINENEHCKIEDFCREAPTTCITFADHFVT